MQDAHKSKLNALKIDSMPQSSSIDPPAFWNNVQTSPTMIFNQLYAQQKILEARIAQLEDRLAENKTINAANTMETDEEAESDTTSQTKQHATACKTKTVKVPDPPKLTDGADPNVANWKYLMEQKFAANADHFDTPTCRLAYLISCTADEAQNQLLTRMRSKVLVPIADVEDALGYLELLFDVPELNTSDHWIFRRPDAKRTKQSNFWYGFRVFMYNAVKYEIPEGEWRTKLYDYMAWKYEEEGYHDFSSFWGDTPKDLAKEIYLRWIKGKWEDWETECITMPVNSP